MPGDGPRSGDEVKHEDDDKCSDDDTLDLDRHRSSSEMPPRTDLPPLGPSKGIPPGMAPLGRPESLGIMADGHSKL